MTTGNAKAHLHRYLRAPADRVWWEGYRARLEQVAWLAAEG